MLNKKQIIVENAIQQCKDEAAIQVKKKDILPKVCCKNTKIGQDSSEQSV